MSETTAGPLLVVPQDDEAIQLVATSLADDGARLAVFSTFLSLLGRSDLARVPTAGLIARLDRRTPGVLELVVALDQRASRVPVVLIAEATLLREMPVETGTSMHVASTAQRPEEIFVAARGHLAAGPRGDPGRLALDYFLMAVVGRRSVRLDMRSEPGVRVYVEILGGDLWNAYGEGTTGLTAIESVLYEPIVEVDVRLLRTIPGERQIELRGPQTFSPGARRLYDLPAPEAYDPPPRPYVRLDPVKDDDGSWLDDAESHAAVAVTTAEASEDEEAFESLLHEGFQATFAGNYERARRAFEEVLEQRPDDPRAKSNLERVLRHLES